MKKVIGFLFSRMFIFSIIILLQIFFIILLFFQIVPYGSFIYSLMILMSIIMLIWLFQLDINPAYKLVWTLVIMSLPPIGGLFYLIWGGKKLSRKTLTSLKNSNDIAADLYNQDPDIEKKLLSMETDLYRQFNYIRSASNSPVYENTSVEYFAVGEEKYKSMLIELEKAKRFIFLEYFIIDKGIMWDTILEILKRKVKQGVDVRLIYDDMGTIMLLPRKFAKDLNELGIKTVIFNPVHPRIYTFMNYRDHRKICVIDGNIGYMGGLNLADEYINVYEKHGHWKDTAFMLKGDAVWTLTVLFMSMWFFITNEKMEFDIYRPTAKAISDGFIQPYGDSPLDNMNVTENEYLNIINKAKNYVYITTPYLILDNEMITALTIAAKSGIDVRIITPGVPDKWFVHYVTQSNYLILIKAGVKIYEYTPGFMHGKMFVSDDKITVVGTANLDYRSLYLHFECCTTFINSSIIQSVKKDIEETIKISKNITEESIKKTNGFKKILQSVLRIFAPLM
ncbi:MAG: cardiolipin synthase [Clostridia bacterium]|nr:cardiolipin synthase [Clostridia bacterium]